MKCRVCDDEELPGSWFCVMWCDSCLTRGLELREERPELTIIEIRDVIRVERGKTKTT